MTFHAPKFAHVNWRAYVTKRVIIVLVLTFMSYAIQFWIHSEIAGKSGELLFGAILGHILLEVEG